MATFFIVVVIPGQYSGERLYDHLSSCVYFPLFLPFPYNVVKVCSAPPQCTFGDQMFNLVNSLFFSESGMSSYGYHRGPGGGGYSDISYIHRLAEFISAFWGV